VEIDELVISQAIIDRYFEKLKQNLEVDVAIVGGGPSGLVAGYYLAAAGKRVVLFERKLSIGGGMWGGGMLFNEIVVQQAAMHILEQFGIRLRPYGNGYYTADSVESVACLIAAAMRAGLTVLNGISVEDVMMRENRINGLVFNWSPVEMAGLHVDPLSMRAKCTMLFRAKNCRLTRCLGFALRETVLLLRAPALPSLAAAVLSIQAAGCFPWGIPWALQEFVWSSMSLGSCGVRPAPIKSKGRRWVWPICWVAYYQGSSLQ